MIRFAGILDPRGAHHPELLDRMAGTFDGRAKVISAGPVAVAWTGGGAGQVIVDDDTGVVVAMQGAPRLRDGATGHLQGRSLAREIAGLYVRNGQEILDRLQGDFALALVDPARERALLATDRFGVRRMHVAQRGDQVLFGTELTPLKAGLPDGGRLSPEALYRYLYFYAVPAPHTIYQDVNRLEAGHCFDWTPSRGELRRYWVPEFGSAGAFDPRVARERLFHALDRAVERVHASSSQVGAFLSGGLDSSVVAGLASRHGPTPCFHVSFDDAPFDESGYARRAANWFGLPLEETCLAADTAQDLLLRLSRHFDEPFGNSSAIPAALCAQQARAKGVDFMLAGDGGDEIFGGNERYVRQKLIARWETALPARLRRALASMPGGLQRGPLRRLARISALSERPLSERMLDGASVLDADPFDVLHPDLAAGVRAHGPVDDMQAYATGCPSDDWLYTLHYVDMKYTLADNDLRKVAAACDLAGVEFAYPMLDEDVVEVALSVPSDHLIRRLRLRHFYKNAVAGFLPSDIINKKKQGFGMPFSQWLAADPGLNKLAQDALADLEQRDIIAPAYIHMARSGLSEDNAAGLRGAAWDLVVLELWLKAHAPGAPV
ncbi:hypothetical protein CKO28_13065 [Rhodovibrio sodomensis]|uniref:asparagine synthase (glutamine-hydrolyzing) n=1 Tax=Rhodovibrio sodomensis TaxID=1088 RepID=A0ABS1DG96_9PROT|nr:asparagine synthase-related protein [Rhodovibrio sodomensis]MBK1668962.1 hypothetical protein [Rhodovibrio sodomensis]